MGNKWEDILPLRHEHTATANGVSYETEEDKGRNIMREECLNALCQAEKEGKVVINVPTELELAHLIFTTITKKKDNIKTVATAISERIRKGE